VAVQDPEGARTGPTEPPLDRVGEQLARRLHVRDADLQKTLDAIVTLAASTVPSAAHAGLMLVHRGELLPQATTGLPPHDLDVLQRQTGVGPCLEAASDQTMVLIDETRTDQRWGEFNRHAYEKGVRSMVCAPLWIDDQTIGTLSLYGTEPGAFNRTEAALAQMFATHAAIALANARQASDMRAALRNRDTIGQAKGVLMERHRLNDTEAFNLLAEASQRLNRKLVEVARDLTETGELPG
jgi:GAF domain-containing protein